MNAGVAVWSSAAWRAEATAWLDARLLEAGRSRTGPVEQPRVRPWATLLTAPTDAGPVWLKACAPATAHELTIYAVLTRVARDRVLVPLAADAERGWLLLPDGGPDTIGSADGPLLARALAAYGDLQVRAAGTAEELVAAGVPDMRPAVLVRRFDELLETFTRAEAAALASWRPRIAEWAAQLAELPGEPSLDHNDLHPGNILAGGRRFYDWGDAVIAHPFACLLMPVGYAVEHLKLPADPLLDAYLAPFAEQADPLELRAAIEPAVQLAKVARACTWRRVLALMEPGDPDATTFAFAPQDTLGALADPPFARML